MRKVLPESAFTMLERPKAATMARNLALVALGILVLGCSGTPTKPKPPIDQIARTAYFEPIWAPSGSPIVFNHIPLDTILMSPSGRATYEFEDSMAGSWAIDSSGVNLHRIALRFLTEMTFAPDGARIAYVRNGDIYSVPFAAGAIDSAQELRITTQGGFFGPSWSPSGSTIATFRPSGSNRGLFLVDVASGALQTVGNPDWRDPHFCRATSNLTFVGTVGGQYGICSADSNGGNPTLLAAAVDSPELPRWSPDGSKVAFLARDRSAGDQTYLWVMESNGTSIRKVSPYPAGRGFAWRPDGGTIVYVRHNLIDFTLANGTLWIVDQLTGQDRQLTFNGSAGQ